MQGRLSKETWNKMHILQEMIPYSEKVKNVHGLIPFNINEYIMVTYKSLMHPQSYNSLMHPQLSVIFLSMLCYWKGRNDN